MPRRLTPQQKKDLSYDRDCRNVYGENDKSSRKNIPRSKRRAARAYRRRTNDLLGQVELGDRLEETEARVGDVRYRGDGISTAWRKYPDLPLRQVLRRNTTGRLFD